MEIVRDIAALRDRIATLRQRRGAIGLVPTMGALHAGHLALIGAARAHGAAVASIFVNPLQFGRDEDLARYPRDEAADVAALAAAGCDLAWIPEIATMYGPGDATVIDVSGPAGRWEGEARPGHFRGVATVVAKLFGQVQPDRAFFGEKDWQQCQVVRRMAADLNMNLEVVPVPTIREADGLAMSSRNRFLEPAQRDAAPALYRTLRDVAERLRCGPADPTLHAGRAALQAQGFAVDYLALVDAASLEPLTVLRPSARLIVAARLGSVRLIDNISPA